MPDSVEEAPESARASGHDLDDLVSTVARLVADTRAHGRLLDRLTDEFDDPAVTATASAGSTEAESAPDEEEVRTAFILALDEDAYAAELKALRFWVDNLLLPVYGREITTNRPWCRQWYEHPEAVARLHALWLAWQQLTDVEAGPAGPSTWHRDHLDPTLLQLRAPDGPFAACTTNPGRPNHRLLATPQNGPEER
ncbi:DUF4913 domain-containing protein [Streptomyces sp. S1A]|uniref:DUF4913 domain-containing protein n=1 Tax=Streptomyces sp. ICN903 TaxID=2964654 RepID=UPI001EDC156C|nr:DUF4913 domain-containing protein [Streptomyces sp. ICN903]MCG3039014.1 DUF4913 domain-containing protein [Streptomyces sp. ICN903]